MEGNEANCQANATAARTAADTNMPRQYRCEDADPSVQRLTAIDRFRGRR